MPENVFHSFQHTYSPAHNVSATEYHEIIEFCKKEYFYYAVKAEDVCGEGKVHVHFMGVKEFGDYAPSSHKDLRYCPARVSHIKDRFWKACPQSLLKCTNKKVGLAVCQLTDTQTLEYYNKETLLKSYNLPDDMVILREYMAVKGIKIENQDIVNHCTKYQEMNYPMPATNVTVWEYLNCRWVQLNDLKITKQEIHQVALVRSIVGMLNGTSLEMPKVLEKKPMDSKKRKQVEDEYKKLDLLTRMNHELFS
jgi:hypothetical protein